MARLLVLLMLLLAGGALHAQPPRENAIAVSLVPEARQVAPGDRVSLAFVMRPRAGWHGYWRNPGDAGTEARVAWTAPEGVEAGPLRYPVPQRLIIAGLMNYVFEDDYALLTELAIPAGLAQGTRLPVTARIDYLACTDEICVPETATVSTELEVAAAPSAPENRALFDGFRRALPRPLGTEARFERAGERLRIGIPLPASIDVEDPYFFPAPDGALRYSADQSVSRNGDWLIVETEAGAGESPTLEGVLAIGGGEGFAVEAAPGQVPAAGAPLGTGSAPGASILLALLGALVGGLLLNIMPCVFPILSLKALSLARAGGNEAAARREAVAYAAGAVLTCLALGGAILALRAGGAAVGWAFQLQDPRVILALLLLVTALALALAGLYRLPAIGAGGSLANAGGSRGAFWTGALAAFVATPCTGPFMGAALGAAIVLPAAAALAVFAGLGLGLALPFLALGFMPALRRRLPKPGPWMERFQRILSIPMFLTALGLAWVLGRQAGVDGMALGLGAALLLGLALWWVGRRQGRAWLPLAPALAAAVAALLLVPTSAPAPAEARGVLGAELFSETRLAALRAQGRPVFAYFTADWCITCKVNEQGALSSAEVERAFGAGRVAVLVGDWTSGDPAIGRFLEQHGRSGVPLYLYYPPGREPEVLPQLLTSGRLAALPG